ncbi:MAG: type II toxin-antitoxin system RelE family toxin [bacterium]
MSYEIKVHPRVKQDLAHLDPPVGKRIKKRLRNRLVTKPEYFGKPLRGTLKGLWKYRVGDYRVVYRIDKEKKTIKVLLVAHRKDACSKVTRRIQ